MSYVYHAMSAYFDRDNVALPGLAAYFRAASLEERDHATQLMDFQVCACGICMQMQVVYVVLGVVKWHLGLAMLSNELSLPSTCMLLKADNLCLAQSVAFW